ncbi:gamma-glutamylcyclotransferase family protein [Aspergillus saccharolyticus JOP 1030-1]|uniref:Putative gamma-glutamylcyclotransferase n=1 Tax=Aspergillus saccharolyticus JOP 1030-1 TaxID=1450539 RepID=A0A318Z5V8_9EURO|nr:hypothetical protein BP01DRAFT_359145 [Aspergillus saccharolyticus JOP 1030-1]PYH42685.1 hypothetical protein BP01DRAFT_359145 [Aspergillus saccharolyticus JOP 1030-1]
MGDHVLFFYGTLMSPQILHRVIHGRPDPEPWQKAYLTIQPALLPGYRRHRVRGADYPGIIANPAHPGSQGTVGKNGEVVGPAAAAATAVSPQEDAFNAESRAPASVLGTLVTGLTDGDVYRLDLFEGDEYAKVKVRVKVRAKGTAADGVTSALTEEKGVRDGLESSLIPSHEVFRDEVEALTYVWTAGRDRLEDLEWDFEAFKRDKLAWWVEADERDW